MSGGSMDYLYSKVEYAEFKTDTVLRKAFRKHLLLVSEALRSIEWNDSGDGCSREEERIRACLAEGAVIDAAIEEAKEVLKVLRWEVERASNRNAKQGNEPQQWGNE
jgi:hypothetical protein